MTQSYPGHISLPCLSCLPRANLCQKHRNYSYLEYSLVGVSCPVTLALYPWTYPCPENTITKEPVVYDRHQFHDYGRILEDARDGGKRPHKQPFSVWHTAVVYQRFVRLQTASNHLSPTNRRSLSRGLKLSEYSRWSLMVGLIIAELRFFYPLIIAQGSTPESSGFFPALEESWNEIDFRSQEQYHSRKAFNLKIPYIHPKIWRYPNLIFLLLFFYYLQILGYSDHNRSLVEHLKYTLYPSALFDRAR